MTRWSATRRGILTAVGAGLLAGCSGRETTDDETISLLRLREIVPDDGGDPIVADALPIEIEASTLDAAAARVDDLLAELPLPFGPENVPNGHIRQRLTDAASEAGDHVAEARTAPSRLVALSELRRARSEARYAAAGWAFVDRGLTAADLRSDHQTIVGEAESFHADFEHLGADPVEAALVYGQAERLLESARADDHTPDRRAMSRLVTVAEWGNHVESARAHFEDARYLSDRFQSGLPEEAGSVGDGLSAAVETLRADLQRRRKGLLQEPTDDDSQRRWRLHDEMWRAADHSVDWVDGAPGPASGLLMATRGLVALLAHDRLTDRLDDGETFGVETAADVGDARQAAVEAITSAREESPRTDLARPMLAEAARSVRLADDHLREIDRDVAPTQLDRPIVEYTAATLRARSVPAACETVLDALDN